MECDGCTLCCKLINVPWMDSPEGEWCKECDIGTGCKIWNNVSDDCRNFKCVYNDLDAAPIELRPDKCKIIFENVDGSIFLGTMHPDHNDAYKKEIIKIQVDTLLKNEISVIFTSTTIGLSVVFPSKGRKVSEVWETLIARWKEKNDSTFIHN